MINFDNWKLFSKFYAKGSRDHVLGVYVCLDVHGARCICSSSTVFSRIRAAAII